MPRGGGIRRVRTVACAILNFEKSCRFAQRYIPRRYDNVYNTARYYKI